MARFFGFVVAVCLLCGVALAQTLTPQAFTERFAEALRSADPSARISVVRELGLVIRQADGSSNDVNLTNVYREYRGQPERFGDLVTIFARALKNPIPAKLERSRVVPMIKSRAWLDEIAPIFRAHGDEPLFEPFNKELVIAYAEDSETRARYLSTRDDVGDRTALRELAIANLKRILPKIEMRQRDNGIALITAGANYEPSLLLVDEVWSSGQITVEGDIVVAIPTRDALLVTGSKNRNGLKALRAAVEKLAEGPYRLTDALFVYRESRFVKFGGD